MGENLRCGADAERSTRLKHCTPRLRRVRTSLQDAEKLATGVPGANRLQCDDGFEHLWRRLRGIDSRQEPDDPYEARGSVFERTPPDLTNHADTLDDRNAR